MFARSFLEGAAKASDAAEQEAERHAVENAPLGEAAPMAEWRDECGHPG